MDVDPAKILNDILYREEGEYLSSSNVCRKEREEKLSKLINLKNMIQSKDIISPDDFDDLRQYAIQPGGFLTLELRKIIYGKIFAINQVTTEYDLILIDESKIPDYKIDNYELKVFILTHDEFDVNRSQEPKIIEADVKRSKLSFTILKHKEYINSPEKIIESMKRQLHRFITEMTSINNSLYNYYQGYHDIGLFFLYLYYDDFRYAVESFQRFSEFFLKEHLLNPNEGYNFTNSLSILKEIIKLIDKPTYESIENCYNGVITFAISWILTCFSHNINNSAIQYRLLDYFVVSHPICIYHLSAWIIIEESKKMKSNIMNEMSMFLFFQDINMDEIDYDYYIMKTEESMNKYPIDTVQALMKKMNMKHSYPLINDVAYTKKWIMHENVNKEGYFWYFKGKMKAMWSFFSK